MVFQSHPKIRRAENISSCTENGVFFLQLAAEKKDTIFGEGRKSFGPFYFVTALVAFGSSRLRNNSTLTLVYICKKSLFDAAQIK